MLCIVIFIDQINNFVIEFILFMYLIIINIIIYLIIIHSFKNVFNVKFELVFI